MNPFSVASFANIYVESRKIIQFSSVAQSCPTLCNPMNHSTLGLPVHHWLPDFTQLRSIESVIPSNHLLFCHSLLLLPSIFPSIRVFSNESAFCLRWPKYWSFSFSISLFNECSGLISFRTDLLVGSPRSPRDSQESSPTHSLKASVLQRSAFFMVHHLQTWLLKKP